MARTRKKKTRATKRRGGARRRKPARKTPAAKPRKTRSRKAASRTGARKTARKTPRKPAARRSRGDVMGEGNYSAARRFRKSETAFVDRNRARIHDMGEAAQTAMKSAEGAELRAAEAEAASHSHAPSAE